MLKTPRRENDAYYTETAVTLELLRYLIIKGDETFVEPCNGIGNISKTIEERYPDFSIYTNDIDTNIPDLDFYGDASVSTADVWAWKDGNGYYQPADYDLCISNPPYNRANQIVPLMYKHCTVTAVLMRLSWLEPTKERQQFLQMAQKHLALVGILNPRPRFGSKGTDSVTSCWLVWDKNKPPETETKVMFMDKWQEND